MIRTWLDLLNLLENQPLSELRRDICIHSSDGRSHTEYEIRECVFPMEFTNDNGDVLWYDWKDGGMMPQIILDVKSVLNYEKKED